MEPYRIILVKITLLFVIFALAGCAQSGAPFVPSGLNQSVAPLGAVRSATQRGQLGPVLTAPEQGGITGWDISQDSGFGLLSAGYNNGTRLETFDLSTAKVTRLGSYQPAAQGKVERQLIVLRILANDLALVDDLDFKPSNFQRDDTYGTVSPAENAKITGRWTPPDRKDLLVQWVGVNQATTTNAVVVDRNTFPHRSAGLLLDVSDVAKNTFERALRFERDQVFTTPDLVAQDTSDNQLIAPMQLFLQVPFNPFEPPSFDVYDQNTGKHSVFSPGVGSGAVQGVAIDSSTHMMCTTTADDADVEFYDLKAKTGFAVSFPGSVSQLNAGGAVAVDQVNHLFIVTQPNEPAEGSVVFVYDEKGNLQEEIPGFSFSNVYASIFAYVAVNPKLRIGYATGPRTNPDQLQSFSY